MTSVIKESKPNALIHETSPYLLQHAYNPVNWQAWSKDVLDQAKLQKKPILLSIGYSSCHWCHVMERESFSNPDIASIMNEHFICVKVDREERPDLDDTFMEATCALNQGRGGWPMTVFLTPDRKPFFAGTYFPPYDSQGKTGFKTVLLKLGSVWSKHPEDIVKQARELAEHIHNARTDHEKFPIGDHEITACIRHYLRQFDIQHGGFGPAPKFPPCEALNLLLRYYKETENHQVLNMVTKTLDAMMKGGIFDHLAGGFARYSVDHRWLIPHFEKMLYDNAQLASVYTDTFLVTGEERYKKAACETLDFVLKEMTSSNGSFFSSIDADTEGVEGKFYLWTKDEIATILSEEEAAAFTSYYQLSPISPNSEFCVLNMLHIEDYATFTAGIAEKEHKLIKAAKSKLLKARLEREKPFKDDKAIVAWNALMISAMIKAGAAFSEPRYTDAAIKAALFIHRNLADDQERVFRLYRKGKKSQPAFLEDYAYLANAYLDLYEFGCSESFLQKSLATVEILIQDFRNVQSGVFENCAEYHDMKSLSHQDGADSSLPNPNAKAAFVIAKLAYHFDRPELKNYSIEALSSVGRSIHEHPHLYPSSLSAVDFHLSSPINISCIAKEGDDKLQDLIESIHRVYVPNKILVHFQLNEKRDSASPILQNKTLLNDEATVYICRDKACLSPFNRSENVINELQRKSHSERNNIFGLLLPGKATPSGTGCYSTFHSKVQFSKMGTTGLVCSPLGYGTYRVHEAEHIHSKSLETALLKGCNLIDTSTNYMDGAAELCVGKTLRKLCESKQISRNQVIIITKIGYIQGRSLDTALEKEKSNTPFPEVSKISDECWHCIHPSFIEEQLHLSRARLQIETIDFLLLHNPEYFFIDPKNEKKSLKELRAKFYEKICSAFTYLEEQVKKGFIQYYGISSNTIADSTSSRQKTHIDRLIEAAEKAGGKNHHFRIVQFPLNLIESQAVLRTEGVLEKIQEHKLAAIVNRPLNAIYKDSMVRIADFPKKELPIAFEQHVRWGHALEDEWKSSIAPFVQLPETFPLPGQLFNWAQTLHDLKNARMNLMTWADLDEERITPQLNFFVSIIEKHIRKKTPLYNLWSDWKKRYLLVLQPLIQHLKYQAINLSHAQSEAIRERITPWIPENRQTASLSKLALWITSSTPGVCCVLNGMKALSHTKDSLPIMRWKKLQEVNQIYQALQDHPLFQRSYK